MMIRSRTSLSVMSLQRFGTLSGLQVIQRIGPLETSASGRHDARLPRFRVYLWLTGGTALVALLAFLAGTANGAAQPRRVAFSVTLKATVTKQWNAVTQTTENGCPTSHGSVGQRTVTL